MKGVWQVLCAYLTRGGVGRVAEWHGFHKSFLLSGCARCSGWCLLALSPRWYFGLCAVCGLANLRQFACIAYLCACDTKHCIAYYVLTHCITVEKWIPRQLSYEMCQGYIYSCFQALVVKKRVWYTLLTRAQSFFWSPAYSAILWPVSVHCW